MTAVESADKDFGSEIDKLLEEAASSGLLLLECQPKFEEAKDVLPRPKRLQIFEEITLKRSNSVGSCESY
jgi:hypothetical protein